MDYHAAFGQSPRSPLEGHQNTSLAFASSASGEQAEDPLVALPMKLAILEGKKAWSPHWACFLG